MENARITESKLHFESNSFRRIFRVKLCLKKNIYTFPKCVFVIYIKIHDLIINKATPITPISYSLIARAKLVNRSLELGSDKDNNRSSLYYLENNWEDNGIGETR